MTTFLAAFAIVGLAVGGLAAGLILRGRELKGSCGGLNTMTGVDCPVCGAKKSCEEKSAP